MTDTSTIIVRPLENYQGDCTPISLQPWIGTDYFHIPECQEILYDLNNWQLITALEKIDTLIKRKPQYRMDLWRLKAEIFGLYDKYDDLYKQLEVILEESPYDRQALFLTSIYGRLFNVSVYDNPHFHTLKIVDSTLAKKLVELVQFVEKNTDRTDFENELSHLDNIELIGIFGYLVHEDGTLSETLEKRASKALELSKRFPDAEIIVSGGAVNSTFVESFGIRDWFIDHDVEEERIIVDPFAKDTVGNIHAISNVILNKKINTCCLVSSLDHLPRCWMGVNTYLRNMGVSCDVYGAAYEKPYSIKISEAESYREYQTLLRAAGFFLKSDFER